MKLSAKCSLSKLTVEDDTIARVISKRVNGRIIRVCEWNELRWRTFSLFSKHTLKAMRCDEGAIKSANKVCRKIYELSKSAILYPNMMNLLMKMHIALDGNCFWFFKILFNEFSRQNSILRCKKLHEPPHCNVQEKCLTNRATQLKWKGINFPWNLWWPWLYLLAAFPARKQIKAPLIHHPLSRVSERGRRRRC